MTLAKAAVLFARIMQVALGLVATIIVVGSLVGGMNVIAFAALGVFALVLLALAGLVELFVVWPIRARPTEET